MAGDDLVFKAILDTDELDSGFKAINKGFAGVQKVAGEFAQNMNRGAADALNTFGVNLNDLSNPLGLMAKGLKESIDFTAKWADEVDQAARITGTGAREASKLLTVLGDYGMGTQQVIAASRALKDQGLTPTLDTLKELAAQYQAIEDPAARNAFGTQKLGRAYTDLSEIMTKTPEEFDALAAAAERSGKIVGDDFVNSAQDAALKAQLLTDKIDGAKLALGSFAIDVGSKAMTSLDQLGMIVELNTIRYQENMGAISHATAVMQTAALVGGDLQKAAESLGGSYGALDESTRAATREQEALTAAQTTALTTAVDPLALGLQKLTAQTLYQNTAAGLGATESLALARAFGLVDEKSIIAGTRMAELRKAFDEGKMPLYEFINRARELGEVVGALQSKTITIDMITRKWEEDRGGGTAQQTGGGIKRAFGGDMVPGQRYIVGDDGPEFVDMGHGLARVTPIQNSSNTRNYTYAPTYGAAPAAVSENFALMAALSGA